MTLAWTVSIGTKVSIKKLMPEDTRIGVMNISSTEMKPTRHPHPGTIKGPIVCRCSCMIGPKGTKIMARQRNQKNCARETVRFVWVNSWHRGAQLRRSRLGN